MTSCCWAVQSDMANILSGVCHLFRMVAKCRHTAAYARSLLFRLREFYVMWLCLRNILAPEQVHSTDTSPTAHLKRKSAMSVAASAALLGSAMVALGTPAASGAVSNTLSRAAAPGTNGLAVAGPARGALPQAPGAAKRLPASDLPISSAMQIALDELHKAPSLHNDLQAQPPVVLSLNESVLVTLCQINPSVCTPLAPPASPHEWAGRIIVGTGKTVSLADGSVAIAGNGAHSALSDAAPLDMPRVETGSYAGEIKGGLHAAWMPTDLPVDLAAQLGRIFAGRLDAAQQAQAGDYYRIAYERVAGKRAGASSTRVTAVELRLAGRTYRAIWFVAPGRTAGDYYSFDGQRLSAEPFAMPLDYVRVSSPFGYRVHPVTGRRLLHTGVDLTAAPGTPVVAASAGTVQFVGYDSGYGKHVVLRHAQGYTSYYAHLSDFAKGLRVGARVSEGQLLGAVGQTGVATGPHLHFEVRLNNQPTDPLKLTSRSGALPLAGPQRAEFDQLASVAREQLAALPDGLRTAAVTAFPAR
jgi:murein DD-endopeptidase MepM/ murein hydrolase activator NlpD